MLIAILKIQVFCIGCVLKKHNVINWQICYLSVVRDGSFIGEDISLFDMIILILNKGVQRTVNGVILAGLYLYRHGGQAVVITIR